MELFWKTTGLILVTVILGLAIRKTDYTVLLSMAACCIVMSAAAAFLDPILAILWEIHSLGTIKEGFLGVLIKAVGISLVAELAGTICSDAGNAALGKTLHMLASVAIFYLSIPVFRALLKLIQDVLGVL